MRRVQEAGVDERTALRGRCCSATCPCRDNDRNALIHSALDRWDEGRTSACRTGSGDDNPLGATGYGAVDLMYVLIDVADEQIDLGQSTDVRDIIGLLESRLRGGIVEEGFVV